jgi:hypothetical protein
LAAVRRALIVVVLAIGCASSAASAAAVSIRLTGPTATRFGHVVDFAGHVSPGRRGAHVRLYRGQTYVTSGIVRRDGSFRMRVRVGSPGPYVARLAKSASAPVTVRIVPKLAASLVGSRVLGAPLALVASLQPATAGAVRVDVYRSGRRSYTGVFRRAVRVKLGTTSFAQLRIAVSSVPRRGFAAAPTQTLSATLLPPSLSVGTTSPAVVALMQQLRTLHYAVPSASSTFGYDLIDSVYAFQKVQGLDRTGSVDAGFWARLAHPRIPSPRYTSPADHLEVDKTHQVLYVVRGGQIAEIIPVSTAGIAGYYTPEGHFAIYRKVDGWDTSPLGVLFEPMYFTGGYAIHGNPSVPPYPASHGCVRVPMWITPALYATNDYGESVYVYS